MDGREDIHRRSRRSRTEVRQRPVGRLHYRGPKLPIGNRRHSLARWLAARAVTRQPSRTPALAFIRGNPRYTDCTGLSTSCGFRHRVSGRSPHPTGGYLVGGPDDPKATRCFGDSLRGAGRAETLPDTRPMVEFPDLSRARCEPGVQSLRPVGLPGVNPFDPLSSRPKPLRPISWAEARSTVVSSRPKPRQPTRSKSRPGVYPSRWHSVPV